MRLGVIGNYEQGYASQSLCSCCGVRRSGDVEMAVNVFDHSDVMDGALQHFLLYIFNMLSLVPWKQPALQD